jgi:hypothetical protein
MYGRGLYFKVLRFVLYFNYFVFLTNNEIS